MASEHYELSGGPFDGAIVPVEPGQWLPGYQVGLEPPESDGTRSIYELREQCGNVLDYITTNR